MAKQKVLVATLVAALVAAVALPLLGGYMGWSGERGPAQTWASGGLSGLALPPAPPVGMPLTVRLTSTVSSASARTGDRWTGIVVRSIALGRRRVILAGTPVRGVVIAARAARPGASAMLELAVRDLTIGGRYRPLPSVAEAFVAGAPHAIDQVVLKPRTVMVFTLDERIAMR